MIKREFSDVAMNMLRASYFNKDETSVDELFSRVAYAFSSSSAMAERIRGYLHAKWLSTATPITANAPVRIAAFDTDEDDMTRFDACNFKPSRNLPISCNLLHVPDTIKGIIEHASESRYLSIFGAGLGANWSNVRPAGPKSPGPIPFLKTHDDDTLAYFQGQTRRGAYAAYLSVYHPYIRQFIHLRDPAHLADENVKTFNIHNAVILDDAFMDAARDNRNIKLIDPNTKEVVEEINARDLWFEILEVRGRTGEPFLINIDRVIEKFPPSQLALGLLPSMSNLCTEITLAVNEERTAVCCLSSPNAEYFDEWAPVADQFIGDVTEYLDNVLEYYIRNAPDELRKAKFSAMRERAIGIGTIGFHAYLQRNMIAFESAIARSTAKRIQKTIQDSAIKRSLELGARRGEAPDMVGTGRRNSHLTAIAPNASTSNILTTSPSIEPYRANAYRQRIQTGQIFIRNRYLEKLLESKGANTPEVWDRIKGADGSVAGLSDILTEYERDVFKTALEINQMWLVEHAEARQDHLCQAQSLNLFFKPGVDIRHLHAVHWRAMRKLKTLYYMRSTAIINADRQVKIEVDDNFVTNPDIVVDQRNMFDPGACLSCEG